mmetsp:Transcript_11387/g.10046  ORF Transcript_11387/g.10046 Transcript_11387/m.10046 type:complete len:142 (-) Transcript_11387:1246-1671(-)
MCKETYYSLNIEYLHEYYLECLDTDPANGEYIYNLVNSYYQKHEFGNALLLGEKYLLLNDTSRKYNKVKILKTMIYILADVYHKYDDAIMYAGDLLNVIEEDFTLHIKNKISSEVYTTVGALFATYAKNSDYHENKILRFK